MFGFKLASSGSELYLGGTNSAHYSGSIEYHDVDQSTGFWQIPHMTVFVGLFEAGSGFETIIDSGTTIMYGPPAAVKEVYGRIPGSGVFDASQGFYFYPCDRLPAIAQPRTVP